MLTRLISFFLPEGPDVSVWSAYSRSRYLVHGHLITMLIALLGMAVNISPFDVVPFFVDACLILIMAGNLFLLRRSVVICRFNFYLVVWVVIFGLATYVNPDFGYEYYFMIWSVSAVMLFANDIVIYIFFALGVVSFHLPKLITHQTDPEFNFNPPFLFLMLLLIFRVFYSTNRYHVKLIEEKNELLEQDKQLIQRQANKIREVSSLQTRFFTNISHEFRTPLTLITGPIRELIDDGAGLHPKHVKQLRLAGENSERLLRLVEEILDLSKLEAGHAALQVARTDLVPFLKGIAGTFQSVVERKGIDFRFVSDRDTAMAWVDKGSLEKITVNLLANAYKHTGRGGEVTMTLDLDNEAAATISIKDTGRGIPKEKVPHIFDRFYHTQSDVQGSSGIGLSIVRLLAGRLGGSIQVDSVEGRGSVFTLRIPVGRQHWQPEDFATVTDWPAAGPDHLQVDLQEPGAGESARASSPGKACILVIEDNADVGSFIAELLSTRYSVLTSQSGAQGVALALKKVPDLVVCDVMMPGKDGFEVSAELKSNELTCHIPVILLTAKADKPSMLRGLGTAADDYLVKPFDRDELMARIATLLENRKKLMDRFSVEAFIGPGNGELTSLDQQFFNRVVGAIQANLQDESFSVEQLAREIGMSRSQVHRKLTAIAGKSANQLIRSIRLNKARDLVAKNVANISEIAYMTGFSTPNYFNACFKEEFGLTPGEMRSRIRNE